MAETVQCPVCTLYLHAGMNLSDHLETHPKEQVIRALVQMTISGSGAGGSNNSTLPSVLNASATNNQSADLEEKPSIVKDNELDTNCTDYNASKTTDIPSLSDQSANRSQNLKPAHNLYETKTEPQNENEREKTSTQKPLVPVNAVVKTETTNTVATAKINVVTNENVSQCFSKQSYNQTISVSSSTTNASHSYRNSLELVNSTCAHNNFNVFGSNSRYEQQRTSNHNQLPTLPHMPPPPPPPPASPQIEHSGQLQDAAGRGILPVGTSGPFHSIHPLQLPPPPPPHHTTLHLGNSGNLRQTQLYQTGQHPPTNSHHTQNLKVIYTPNLPPPPPLQLFTYQPQTHLQQHQKPPPAYGTAISQIRSQHNQSKHQVTGSLSTQQHPTMQAHSVLQQHLTQQHLQHDQSSQHNVRIQIPPPSSPLPIADKNTYSQKNNDLSNHIHSATSRHTQSQQQQQQSKVELSQRQPQPQQQEQEQQQSQLSSASSDSLSNQVFNSNEIMIKSPSKVTSSATLQNSNLNANVPPSYPQVSISPSAASTSMASVAASTLARHTNSPFAALLAAAAGAPSPSNTSSVLRYAESPVAHYLERENGDFIVQETPKHIVECVETDNGEFSVIERIYQSPPSVLHIHDEGDDEENEDDKCRDVTEGEKPELAETKSKQHDAIEKELGKTKDKRDLKTTKPLCRDVKLKKSQTQSQFDVSADDEIVDFVSISSESSDEEEFISQRQKDLKNTTDKNDKNKKNRLSSKCMPTTSMQCSSTLPTIETETDDNNQTPLSSTPTPLHTSPSSSAAALNTASTQNNSANNTTSITSRKKSSKNTITVLSDVQLNLNEYLDLVGNIIASSKVASHRKTFTSIAPIPLVKIEKEEPMDDYVITNTTTSTEIAPHLNANKHETEEITDIPKSNKKTTSNHKIILADELEQDEKEEKKPQVFVSASENEISFAISNASPSHMSINSSQVTSVIRMATTSQHQQQEKHQNSVENNRNCNEAEDLSQPQQKVQSAAVSKILSHTPLARKGPKKLIIKPKSTKTEVLLTTTTESKPNQNQTIEDHELPSTSSCTARNTKESSTGRDMLNATDIKIKNEPITSTTYGNFQQQLQYTSGSNFSILEQHLSSKEPILEFKEEKPCITEASLPSDSIIKEMKVENNVNDDARVLYDFANSKKSQNETSSTFPSSKSLFSCKQTSPEITLLTGSQDDQNNKNVIQENESTTSTYSSQSVMDVSTPPEEQNESSATSVSVSHTSHQTIPVYNDFHFSYLYNNNMTAIAAEQTDVKNHQFSSFYQNSTNNNNNIMLQEDSSSSKHYTDYQQLQSDHSHLQQHQVAPTSHDQWFNNNNNYHTTEHNVSPISSNQSACNVNSGLSAEGDNAGNETSKYLDLDSCKREQNIDLSASDRVLPPPPPSSSTSCSFNGTAENSMAGGCSSAVTLNIRTDEKMPAKGEISEQESNCDIDNSWSQPMYGDISARFFKTTFPSIFPPDSGWNHDEYFTVQDLSASTNVSGTNSTSNRIKSFDQISGNNNNGMPIFSQNSNDNCNIDVMPSTSAKIRKKRKRYSQDEKSFHAIGKRMQPTSTVTSQEMLTQHQNEISGTELNFQNQSHHQLQQHHLQQSNTSTSFLEGPLNGGTLATSFMLQQQQQQQSQTQQKQRTKVYECGHCNAKYSKLKDRNAHMIDVHNYIRQNRRLVCPTTGLATPLGSSDNQDVALPTTSAAGNMPIPALQSDHGAGDFKQDIVKIENENPHRDLSAIETINAELCAKAEMEMEDDKHNVGLVSTNATTKLETVVYDSKPSSGSFPLSLTTPSGKLTTLYRMLVSFNMTTLKQHQSLSELDENLIKSSIFFCYICRQNFNSVKLYDAHLTEHPAECFTCGKKFQRWKNFSLHLKRHLGWKEFGCTVCDKKFVVRSALVEHMRMHSGLSPLKCKVCGKHFKRYSNLTQHRKRHTKQIIRRKEYVCYCGEVLPSKARFLWHKEIHDLKPKCCPHCCDRFVHVNSLRRHIRLAHSDKFDYTEPMECPICKQIFAKASMKAHMATHSAETQYDCAICSKSFSTKWNLKIHSWVHANRTTKPFKCEHCPKAFVREVDFKNHMNSHKQIKPYTCEVCGCKFIRKYNYMRHRREHHGNKKYTCDLCKKSFHRHYYLIEHRRIHTGERPFQCSICGKSSTTKTNHNKHLKIHHSRDPFTVEV